MFHYSVLNTANCQHSGSGTDPVVKMSQTLKVSACWPHIWIKRAATSLPNRSTGRSTLATCSIEGRGLAADGLFAGKTKPSVGYTARFVPLEGDISQTPSVSSSQNDFF